MPPSIVELGNRREHFSSMMRPAAVEPPRPRQPVKPTSKLRVSCKARDLGNLPDAHDRAIFRRVYGVGSPGADSIIQDSRAFREEFTRSQCMQLLHALSRQKARIWLRVRNEEFTVRCSKGDSVDMATALILSVALRPKTENNSWLIGELTGIAKPSTLKYLEKYLRPPLVDSSIITSLVSASARQISQPRQFNNGNTPWFGLFEPVAPIIAGVIGDPKNPTTKSFLRGVLKHLIEDHPGEHQERGLKLGFLLAGIRIAIQRCLDKGNRYQERFELILDCVFGAASSVDQFGVMGILQPIIKEMWRKRAEHRKFCFEKLWKAIKMQVYNILAKHLGTRDPGRFKAYSDSVQWMDHVMDRIS